MKIKTIIVDDEPLARINIRSALDAHPDWSVLCELDGGEHLDEVNEKYRPDVIFLDIQMPRESGLDIARRLIALPEPPLIIFVTAYSEHAVEAFELRAIDYLLKPFDQKRFASMIEQAESILVSQKDTSCKLERQRHFLNHSDHLEHIAIKSVGSIKVIYVKDIYWLSSAGNYVEIHHTEGVDLHRITLSHLEKHLDPKLFARTHRSVIAQIGSVKEIKSIGDDKYEVILCNSDRIKLSASYRDHLFDIFGVR